MRLLLEAKADTNADFYEFTASDLIMQDDEDIAQAFLALTQAQEI